MAQTLLPPWAPIPIKTYHRNEFQRRANNYGISYDQKNNKQYDVNYKGPMSPWIRCVSNTLVKNKVSGIQREGFILYGGKGFEDRYGINTNGTYGKQVIGYDLKGDPHIIDNADANTAQPFRPNPAIKSIDVKIKMDVYRTATIRWDAFSLDQMNYMSYYFFTPRNTILLEWGWNNFDQSSMIDLSNPGKFAALDDSTGLYTVYSDSENPDQPSTFTFVSGSQYNSNVMSQQSRGILDAYSDPYVFEYGTEKSNGNYDGMIGQVFNWSYIFNDATLTYECTTEIASNSKYYMGLSVRNYTFVTDAQDDSQATVIQEFNSYWDHKFEADVKSAQGKTGVLINNNVDLNGRYFNIGNYANSQHSSSKIKHNDNNYVTIGFFLDLLSSFIPKKLNKVINIEDVYIGAHPNLISTDPDVIIPNPYTPVYYSYNILHNTIPSVRKERTRILKGDKGLVPANKLMVRVLNNINKDNPSGRKNLNEILNYNRNGDSSFSFPLSNPLPDDTSDQYLYKGKLTNIYISTKFIKLITKQSDIMEILKALCSKLNNIGLFWSLSPICSDQNTIKIVDTAFTDVNFLKIAKNDLGIDSIIYYLDTTSQLSIVRNFKFDVKLSDAVANSIVMRNQVNKDSTADATLNNRENFDVEDDVQVTDMILPKLDVESKREAAVAKAKEANSKSIADSLNPVAKQALQEAMDARNDKATEIDLGEHNNIDKDNLSVEIPGGIIHLGLNEKYKEKLQEMLNDPTPAFTNFNSMPIPGVTAEFTLNGIGGLKTFQVFGVKALPRPYKDNIVFKIKEINHTVSENVWNTSIISNVIPSRSLQAII